MTCSPRIGLLDFLLVYCTSIIASYNQQSQKQAPWQRRSMTPFLQFKILFFQQLQQILSAHWPHISIQLLPLNMIFFWTKGQLFCNRDNTNVFNVSHSHWKALLSRTSCIVVSSAEMTIQLRDDSLVSRFHIMMHNSLILTINFLNLLMRICIVIFWIVISWLHSLVMQPAGWKIPLTPFPTFSWGGIWDQSPLRPIQHPHHGLLWRR